MNSKSYTLINQIDLKTPKVIVPITIINIMIFLAGIALEDNILGNSEQGSPPLEILYFIVILAAQIILHESIHGLFFKYYGAKKIDYKFHGFAFSSSCEECFTRKQHAVIALAPVVILGIVFTLLMIAAYALGEPSLLYALYYNQVCNIAGSCGDFAILYLIYIQPYKDAVFKDNGMTIDVYSKSS